jgi:hypothetical protein
MKFSPPGSEPYVILSRFDGFLGSDPRDVPNSVAAYILAAMRGRTEVERIKARMLARQLAYNRRKMVSIVRRQRFGLLTR